MNTVIKMMLAFVAIAGVTVGCATTAPPELVEARASFVASNNGLAAKLTPAELHDAWTMLSNANQEFEQHGDTTACRDYAYIAQRKLQLADAKARTAQDRQRIDEAAKAGVAVRDHQVKAARTELGATQAQLKDERRDSQVAITKLRASNTAQAQEIEKAAEQLETEKLAREQAEARLVGAMKDLANIAAIKEETRGLVITLSGSVLFASNKFALLNTAKTKLDQVAEALKAQDSDKRMVVEGHTDSQGSDRINQPLSLNRANAVRDYLVTRGVDGAKISAIGMGSGHPLVDNASSENRANNRRVEIVIQPSHLSVH
jgi:outer membrane protein OmpA-like peptidoglycan-associated protein